MVGSKESANTSLIAGNGYPNDLVHTINAASAITNWSATAYEWSLLSALARAQYSYKGKYMLSAAIRADGSSRFGKTIVGGHSLLYLPDGMSVKKTL